MRALDDAGGEEPGAWAAQARTEGSGNATAGSPAAGLRVLGRRDRCGITLMLALGSASIEAENAATTAEEFNVISLRRGRRARLLRCRNWRTRAARHRDLRDLPSGASSDSLLSR